jgi:hypothetical protein
MKSSLLGLVLVVLGLVSGGFALLITFGTLLEFSPPGAIMAVLCWLAALLLVIVGIRLRRTR